MFAGNVVKTILSGEPIDERKFEALGSIDDLKATFSCVRFLLLNAVRFGVGKSILSIELQQLGLPREHSQALGKVLDENSSALREYLANTSLGVNELIDVQLKESDGIDCVKMELKIKDCIYGDRANEINIKNSDIPILLKELKTIKAKMNEFDYN